MSRIFILIYIAGYQPTFLGEFSNEAACKSAITVLAENGNYGGFPKWRNKNYVCLPKVAEED